MQAVTAVEQEAEIIFKEGDVDGDGTVNFEEFMYLMCPTTEQVMVMMMMMMVVMLMKMMNDDDKYDDNDDDDAGGQEVPAELQHHRRG